MLKSLRTEVQFLKQYLSTELGVITDQKTTNLFPAVKCHDTHITLMGSIP